MKQNYRKTRLQRKREKDSLKQAVKYLFLILFLLYLIVKLGLPGLIKMATFIGNIRSTSEQVEKQDQIAPFVPRLSPLPEATKSASLNISGFSEVGTTVQLFLRGISVKEIVTNSDGEFQFKNIHIREGNNEIYTIARDDQGNTSDKSTTWTVIMDSTAPILNLDAPNDGDKFFDKDSPVTVSGKTGENVNLRINNRLVMVNSDGSFETKISLTEGDNEIEIVVKDEAGNETRSAIMVNYTP